MSTCCSQPVYYVTVGKATVIVDAEPHPAGIFAVYASRNPGFSSPRYFGYRLSAAEPPRSAAHTRHRVHRHRQEDQ